jgi:septal ring factor EnvC (AmiA/AmiB activator)
LHERILSADCADSRRFLGKNFNEFLKEHKKVQELTATVAQQQKGMEVLTAQLKEQAAHIQKVSAQLEVSKPAAKFVVTKP